MRPFALTVLAVSLLGFCWAVRGAEPTSFPNITFAELQAALANRSVTLLDCNGTARFNQGHVPGALNFEAVRENLAAQLPADKGALVVAYCGSEKCGAYKAGANAAAALGYTNVKHFAPGIKGWAAAGGQLEPPAEGASAKPAKRSGCSSEASGCGAAAAASGCGSGEAQPAKRGCCGTCGGK